MLSLIAVCAFALMMSSCTQEELRSSDAELNTEMLSQNVLPLLAPFSELDNSTDEALAENATYADFGTTADKNNRDCGYDVYLAQHYHWQMYYYWFYNPTYSNCVKMKAAYCDYLNMYYWCYGGEPLTECDYSGC